MRESNNVLQVNSPSGKPLTASKIVKTVKLSIDGKEFKIDFYILDIKKDLTLFWV